MLARALPFLILLPFAALAEEVSPVVLTSQPFDEVWRPAAEISGAVVVGFAAASAPFLGEADLGVSAMIPGDWRGTDLCLRVTSADGRYESRNSYRVSEDWQGGAIPLPYPSPNPSRLIDLPPGEVTAALWRGDCAGTGSEIALVWWRGGTEPLLMLNTSRADETFLLFTNHPDWPEVTCLSAPATGRIAFDTICPMPAGALEQPKLDVVVIPFRGGEMGREIALTLRGPTG